MKRLLTVQFQPFPEIKTKRLYLRQLTHQDAPEQLLSRSDEDMLQFINTKRLTNKAEAVTQINFLNQGTEDNQWIVWVIALQSDASSRYIGSICLWNLSWENGTAELGYGLLPPYQGNGYMQEALEAVVAFGFQEMKVKTIEVVTEVMNHKSLTLLDRNGFTKVADYCKVEQNFKGEKLIMNKFCLKSP